MSDAYVLVVSSAGGVLLDVLALRAVLDDRVRWAAVPAIDTRSALAGEDVQWVPELRPEHPLKVAIAVAVACRRILRDPPTLIVSAGSGVAVPWFIAGWMLGVKLLWVETWNLVGDHQGLAARLCGRLATAVVVQRPERLVLHRRAVLVGELY